MSKDLELAIQAAKQAGELIRQQYGKLKKITKKGLNDFVTETDVEAEKIIIAALQPTGYSILGEESGLRNNKSRKKWVIDPLDGTNNFIRGFSFFAVSIALIEDDKNLILGVVYDPMADECFWAEKNSGAKHVNAESGCHGHEAGLNGTHAVLYGQRQQRSISWLR